MTKLSYHYVGWEGITLLAINAVVIHTVVAGRTEVDRHRENRHKQTSASVKHWSQV